jgi:hypothetical protein
MFSQQCTRFLPARLRANRYRGRWLVRPHLEALEDRTLPSGFFPGSINIQDGWSGGTMPISTTVDQTVDQSGMHAFQGIGAWRISNSTVNGDHNGAFQGWPFSPGLPVVAGRPSSGAGADQFNATFFFKSANTVADGSNIEVDLGSSAGDDRNNFLAITNRADAAGGLQLRADEPDGTTGNFKPTQTIASNLSRTTYHRVDVVAKFFNGNDSDTFQVTLDGTVLTNPLTGGTTFGTFEGFFQANNQPYVLTNRLFWRSGAKPSAFGAFTDTAAQGFYFDNVSYQVSMQSNLNVALASYAATLEPIAFTPSTLFPAQVGVNYTQAFSGSSGQAPYTYTLTAGALPPGLSLSPQGVLSGTPTAGGSFTFTVMATDSTSPTALTDSLSYTLVVNPAPATANPARFPLSFGAGAGGLGAIVNLQANGQVLDNPVPIPGFTGPITRAVGNFDGSVDTLWAVAGGGGPRVRIVSPVNGVIADFFAFSPGFNGGVSVAVADVNGDGKPDLIVGAGPGGGPRVIVIDGTKLTQIQANGQIADSALLASFFAYTPAFAGGVNVAAADVNGDGHADVVTGAGPGAGPHVEVINGTKLNQVQANGQIANAALLASFFAFDPSFTGGVNVAAGDFNGDGTPDVIVGEATGGSLVRVLNGTKLNQAQANGEIASSASLGDFQAYAAAFTGGVRVDAVDVNGDGKLDIVTGAGPGGGPAVKVFRATDLALLDSFFASDPTFTGGVFV